MSRRVRTFIDAGVVITAFDTRSSAAGRALDIITDPDREIVISSFLELELLPSAMEIGDLRQVNLLQNFFDMADYRVKADEAFVQQAVAEAAQIRGIQALDALHLTAAKVAGADEFITTERPTKPLYKVRGIRVVHFT